MAASSEAVRCWEGVGGNVGGGWGTGEMLGGEWAERIAELMYRKSFYGHYRSPLLTEGKLACRYGSYCSEGNAGPGVS